MLYFFPSFLNSKEDTVARPKSTTYCKYPETKIVKMSTAHYFRISSKIKPEQWLSKQFKVSVYLDPLTIRYEEIKETNFPETLLKIGTCRQGNTRSYHLLIPKNIYDSFQYLIDSNTRFKISHFKTENNIIHFRFKVIKLPRLENLDLDKPDLQKVRIKCLNCNEFQLLIETKQPNSNKAICIKCEEIINHLEL